MLNSRRQFCLIEEGRVTVRVDSTEMSGAVVLPGAGHGDVIAGVRLPVQLVYEYFKHCIGFCRAQIGLMNILQHQIAARRVDAVQADPIECGVQLPVPADGNARDSGADPFGVTADGRQ